MENYKIFIVGLPRTGTTSVCLALLDLGFRVAHTAYTKKALQSADAIADTPIFCDVELLAQQYPNAKFIYLTREFDNWIPSIKQLLQRMFVNLTRTDGGFNPELKRCYRAVFSPLTQENIEQDSFLINCYQRHQHKISTIFNTHPERLLTIDISKKSSYQGLCDFLNKKPKKGKTTFDKVNIGGKITYWNSVKHINKIDSNAK